MFIISKTKNGFEYLYSNEYSILCKSKKQANELAEFLNKNNNSTIGNFKLKEDEKWFTYQIDKYDSTPKYRIKTTKNKIAIVNNY